MGWGMVLVFGMVLREVKKGAKRAGRSFIDGSWRLVNIYQLALGRQSSFSSLVPPSVDDPDRQSD